jgi:hypothetical protein
MATRTTTSTVLIVLLLLFTFPIWLGLGGLIIGLFGAVVGVIAGIFGFILSIALLPFRFIFGWEHCGWLGFPHVHEHGFFTVAFIILIVIWLSKRK